MRGGGWWRWREDGDGRSVDAVARGFQAQLGRVNGKRFGLHYRRCCQRRGCGCGCAIRIWGTLPLHAFAVRDGEGEHGGAELKPLCEPEEARYTMNDVHRQRLSLAIDIAHPRYAKQGSLLLRSPTRWDILPRLLGSPFRNWESQRTGSSVYNRKPRMTGMPER